MSPRNPIDDGYVDVAERIRQFKAEYPDGSLQAFETPRVFTVDGKAYIAYCAAAYRTADDDRPGIGWAWEPVPGPTPFTRDSELMNAETSAWGRAIVALGFETKKIASSEEVRNRQASSERDGKPPPPPPPDHSAENAMSGKPPATEKPATDGLLHQIKLTLKLLNDSFPEHPGEGRFWEDVAKDYTQDKWPERTPGTELTVAQANQLNDWLEDQYRQAKQEMEVPFG